MITVHKKDLEPLVGKNVQVGIYGEESEDTAPLVYRKIDQLVLCPDQTHLRIYFDKHFFVAVPLTSTVEKNENKWIAYDEATRLHYSIQSEVI